MDKCPKCGRSFKSVKIHMFHCSALEPSVLHPSVLEPPILVPVVMIRASEAIRKVKALAKEIGSMEELKAICESL